MIWLHLTFLHDLLDPSTRIFSLCLISLSYQKWATDHFLLLHLPFGILFLNLSALQIHYLLSRVYSRPQKPKVSSTIVINSLHNVSSDFDLRTYNGLSSLPCILSLHSSRITWLHGRDAPPPPNVFIWRRNGLSIIIISSVLLTNF